MGTIMIAQVYQVSGGVRMSISPISSSMMSMYVPSSGTSQKAEEQDYEYLLIQQELMAMGIVPSGDKATDKLKLQTVKTMQEMMQAQSSSSSRQSIPFDDIMNTLNLTVTGDLDKDYDEIVNQKVLKDWCSIYDSKYSPSNYGEVKVETQWENW